MDTRVQRESLASYATLLQREKDLNISNALTHPNRVSAHSPSHFFSETAARRLDREVVSQGPITPRRPPLQRRSPVCAQSAKHGRRFRTPCANASQRNAGVPFRPFHILQFEEGDAYGVCPPTACCLTVYAGEKSVVIASPDPDARQLWLDDLREAVKAAARNRVTLPAVRFEPATTENEIVPTANFTSERRKRFFSFSGSKTGETTESNKNNLSTLHVCWHRQSTIGASDLLKVLSRALT